MPWPCDVIERNTAGSQDLFSDKQSHLVQTVEDERIFGCMEFGIGSQGKMIRGSYWTAASHTDGVVSKPTIIVDGVTIEENGKYVDPQLAEICKQMGVEGY